jgi:capsular exopolysaccharide synthesis family protein
VQVQEFTQPPTDIRRYFGVLWRRKWWIVVPVVLAAVVVFALSSMRDDRFRAYGELLVTQPADTGVPLVDQSLSDEAKRTIENEIELIDSRDTQDAVAELAGRPLAVHARTSGNSDVISVSTENASAQQAADDVNDFTEAYLTLRRRDRLDDLHAVRRQVIAEREGVRQNLQQLQRPIREVEQLIATTPDGPERDALYNERDALRDENNYRRSSLNMELSQLNSTLDAIDGAVELTDGGVEIITAARPPGEPFFPQPKKDTLVAISIALLAGLVLAFAAEFSFDRVTNQEDIEVTLPDDRFLGAIPVIDELNSARPHSVLTFGGEQSLGAEAYRALAASIEFARLEKPVKVIHFTSPVAGEGKSTTAANLAAAFAETGARVAMVDADVRRPELYRILGGRNDVGLSSVLLGRVPLADALRDVDSLPGVKLLSPGELPPNPTKMLYARRTEDVFDALRAEFDVVLVDGPPVLPVADALILTQFSDMTVMVIRSGSTRRRALRRARHALARVEAASLAVVLNAAPLSGPDGYGYYGHYYGSKDEEPELVTETRRRRRR